MKSLIVAGLVFGLALQQAAAAPAAQGKVTLPMPLWEEMLKEIEAAAEPSRPPMSVVPIERRIEGSLRKGLFSGRLTARFEVIADRGHVRVPVLDSGASLGAVRLNGKRTSLLREGSFYTIGVGKPGIYRLDLEFFWGKEQDRFARRLRFRVPEAGTTRVSIVVPERGIEPRFEHGVLVSERRRGDGTELVGHLDSSGILDLTWNRRLTHRSTEAVRIEARINTLFTVQEALVGGRAVFDIQVLEGETDRFDLRLPRDIEILRVEGDAVLQWHTEEKDGGRLTVLFRHLVEHGTRVSVHFQFPVGDDAKARLRMPLPPRDTPMTGALGVQAPAGLNVTATGAENASELTLRDLPPELTDLTSSPLLFGYSFEAPPRVDISVSRHQAVELTSTLIDDLQASTVIIEDGSEITKLKLRLRNNTRQYLSIELPAGAVLTHSLIDGQPLRPAEAANGALLFPLRQSERLEAGRQMKHTVMSGETLTDIANFYYSDPSQWSNILAYNPSQLGSEWDLAVGQVLNIPAKQGTVVQESSFVIEMAYKRKHDPLGSIGRLSTGLPELDVDTVEVTWHLYLPSSLTPISFDANLTQYSAIRYEPFRRVREFLRRARWVRNAWAGGRYKSILSQRKGIYRAEVERRSQGKMVLASFPLVGERFRFHRILLGRDTPHISATYVTRSLGPPLRWGAMIVAFFLAMLLLSPRRERRTWIIAGVSLIGLLVVAHYVLGIHRRIVWGADVALIVTWLRLRGGGLWRGLVEIVRSPWLALRWLRLGTVAWLFGVFLLMMVVLEYPLLLSSVALLIMSIWWRRSGSQAVEVAHV